MSSAFTRGLSSSTRRAPKSAASYLGGVRRTVVVAVLILAIAAICTSVGLLATTMTVHAAASPVYGPAHAVACGRAIDLVHSDFDSEGYDDGKCLPMAERRFAGAIASGSAGLVALVGLVVGAVATRRAAGATYSACESSALS